ncbi:MAG: rspR 3 [Streptosporangiaceae bacterium]|nr:rspR 3 [Streptosporangiaceae bacterium]
MTDHEPERAPASAPETIAAALRTEILALRWPPGTPLREIALKEKYGVSRRSVREALRILAVQGLATVRFNAGASVRELTAADIHELYGIRRVLESAGAENCADASDEEIAKVDDALRTLAQSANTIPDSEDYAQHDMEFHASVIGLLGNKRLLAVFDDVRVGMVYAIRLLHHDEASSALRAQQQLAEHAAIAERILARDPVGAMASVRRHIEVNEARLILLMES